MGIVGGPEREQVQPVLKLSASQHQVAEAVLNSLNELSDQRALIIVLGLTGTGKTATLDSIESRIKQAGAIVTEVSDLTNTRQKPPWVQEHSCTIS